MKDLDQKIRSALQSAGSPDWPSEPNLAEEVLTAFRGRHRWLSALAIVFNLVFGVGVVFAAVAFFRAATVPEQVRWGVVALGLLLMVGNLKMWFWLEMQGNRVLRELKRVELLLVSQGTKNVER